MDIKKFLKPAMILSLVGVVGYGSTSAYLSSFDVINNTTTVGHNDTSIEENFPPVTPPVITNNPSVIKEVSVVNNGTGQALVDCYVRVALSYSNSDIGKAVVLDNLNRSDWIYENGFYYYNKILKKGEKTTPLFTGFHIESSKVEDKYKNLINDFEINVYEESVQAEGFTNARDAFAHYSR